MKTPHAILIGLSLITAAIFFKDTALKPAHAYNAPGTKADVEEIVYDCLFGASIRANGTKIYPATICRS